MLALQIFGITMHVCSIPPMSGIVLGRLLKQFSSSKITQFLSRKSCYQENNNSFYRMRNYRLKMTGILYLLIFGQTLSENSGTIL